MMEMRVFVACRRHAVVTARMTFTRYSMEMRARNAPIVDLIRGNVNEHSSVYPPDLLTEILARAVSAARGHTGPIRSAQGLRWRGRRYRATTEI